MDVLQVRAAAVYALGIFIGSGGGEEAEQRTHIELNLSLTLPVVSSDASAMVRKCLIVALSRLIHCYEFQMKEV